jgi:hypothetical protein
MDRSSGLWWGVILIILGALFLMENLDLMSIDVAVRDYWPVLLVLWGVWMLTRGGPRSRRARRGFGGELHDNGSPAAGDPPSASGEGPSASAPSGSWGAATAAGSANNLFGDLRERTAADTAGYTTVFGDLDIAMESPAFRGGSLSTVFGDARLDLSHATIAGGEQRLKVTGVFGDTTVWLPAGTRYALTAHTLFGGIDANGQRRDGIGSSLRYRMPGFDAAPSRVHIDVSAVFGDITVRA